MGLLKLIAGRRVRDEISDPKDRYSSLPSGAVFVLW
jgi:hypothetical protein